METIYRKVAVSERLPQKEKVYIGIVNTIGEVDTEFYIGAGKFSCSHVAYGNPEKDVTYQVTHWLEEIPSLEAENKELREMLRDIADDLAAGKTPHVYKIEELLNKERFYLKKLIKIVEDDKSHNS